MSVNEIRESEMVEMSAQEVSDHAARLISSMVGQGRRAAFLPPLMLWGPPGVGKSQAIAQAAQAVERKTGKRAVVTDVRLLMFNPVDLRGIPVADSKKEFAVWLMPKIFMMDGGEDVINILFLDEITAAPQSVQAAAYQLTLDRTVGEHRLPDNCVVIAAGNRAGDRSVSFKMPKALANRLCHIEVTADLTAWRDWALTHDIEMSIIGFLCYDPDSLIRLPTVADENAFPTPRSWEMASNMIKLSGSVEAAMPFITGCVGRGAATALYTWTKVWDRLPSIDDIFAGKTVSCPSGIDVLYALVSSMLAYAKRPSTDLDAVKRSVRFGASLPADYAMLLFRGYTLLEGKCDGDIRSELLKVPEFRGWMNKNGKYLDA